MDMGPDCRRSAGRSYCFNITLWWCVITPSFDMTSSVSKVAKSWTGDKLLSVVIKSKFCFGSHIQFILPHHRSWSASHQVTLNGSSCQTAWAESEVLTGNEILRLLSLMPLYTDINLCSSVSVICYIDHCLPHVLPVVKMNEYSQWNLGHELYTLKTKIESCFIRNYLSHVTFPIPFEVSVNPFVWSRRIA